MYSLKYVYICVTMDKQDCMIEQLIYDLERWTKHLYRVDKKDKILYRGLCPVKELNDLFLLASVSPYGNGYEITVDGVNSEYYGGYLWKKARGIA